MKITKTQLRQIIKEEIEELKEDEGLSIGPRELLITQIVSRLEDEKTRLDTITGTKISNEEWRAATDIARDQVFPIEEEVPEEVPGEEVPGEEVVDLSGVEVTPQSIAGLKKRMKQRSGEEQVDVGVVDPRTGRVRVK